MTTNSFFMQDITLKSNVNLLDIKFKENADSSFTSFQTHLTDRPDMSNFENYYSLDEINEDEVEQRMLIAFKKSLNGDGFVVLDDYKRICIDVIDEIKRHETSFYPIPSKKVKFNRLLNLLSTELSTWMLIEALHRERLYLASKNVENIASQDLKDSEADIVNQLFSENSTLRQAQVVIDWLEFQQKCQIESELSSMDFFSDHGSCRENTLHLLMHKEFKIQDGIVSELDPDGPLRQNKKVCSTDEEDENKLLSYIFYCIKSGQLDEAYKTCIKVGQPWRAVTLQGWRLFHDPNVKCLGLGGSIQKIEGNHFRDLWRMACWELAENNKVSVIERALYASLSGNLKKLLPACKTWHECLWAYLKVLVDQRVENHIKTNLSTDRYIFSIPSDFDARLHFEEIFHEIECTTNEEIKKQCQHRFNIMQKFIILNQIETLVECMSNWCKEDSLKPHPILLRFMTHLLLFFKSCGSSFVEEQEATIISSYVDWLIEAKQVEVIATYTSHLPKVLQVLKYARFLKGIQGTEDRKHCMDLAEVAGLNTKMIAITVVQNIYEEVPFHEEFMFTSLHSQEVVEDDMKKIKAIEWLLLDNSWRLEAIQQANALFRKFISFRKFKACNILMKTIPGNSIEMIIKFQSSESKHLPRTVANSVREFMCVSTYLEAQESFSQWFDYSHNAMPKKFVASNSARSLAEKCAQDHLLRCYENDFHTWNKGLSDLAEISIRKIKEVLCFADGGWMVDQEDDDQTSRKHEMSILRQLCLPSLFTLLKTVYCSMDMFEECGKLYDLLMSEHYQLHKVFNKEELNKFSSMLVEASVNSLNRQMDPLGYSL